MNKKILLSIGAIGAIAAPVASIVACGTGTKHESIDMTKIIDPIKDIKTQIEQLEYPKHYSDATEKATFDTLKEEAKTSEDIQRLKEIKSSLSTIVQMDDSAWNVYHKQIVDFINGVDSKVFSDQDKQEYLNTLNTLSNEDKDGIQIYKDVKELETKIQSRAKIKDFTFIKKTSGYYVETFDTHWSHPEHQGFWINDLNIKTLNHYDNISKSHGLSSMHPTIIKKWLSKTGSDTIFSKKLYHHHKERTLYYPTFSPEDLTFKLKLIGKTITNERKMFFWLQKVDKNHPIYTYQTHFHGFKTWATNTLDNINGDGMPKFVSSKIDLLQDINSSTTIQQIKQQLNAIQPEITDLLNITLEHTSDNKLKVTYTPKPLTDDYYGFKTKVDGLDPITKIYE